MHAVVTSAVYACAYATANATNATRSPTCAVREPGQVGKRKRARACTLSGTHRRTRRGTQRSIVFVAGISEWRAVELEEVWQCYHDALLLLLTCTDLQAGQRGQ